MSCASWRSTRARAPCSAVKVENLEASRGASEVSKNITGVNAASQEVAAGATETQASASELAKLGERLKQVVEPAGAAALAAVLTGAVPFRSGDRVAVILSGGNVATERLGELLDRAAPLGPRS